MDLALLVYRSDIATFWLALVALTVTVVLMLWLRRRDGGWFWLCMVPSVVGWMWCSAWALRCAHHAFWYIGAQP